VDLASFPLPRQIKLSKYKYSSGLIFTEKTNFKIIEKVMGLKPFTEYVKFFYQ
jgi:hypothetical protein